MINDHHSFHDQSWRQWSLFLLQYFVYFLVEQIIIMAQIIKPPTASYEYDVMRIMIILESTLRQQDKYIPICLKGRKMISSETEFKFKTILFFALCLHSRQEKTLDGFRMGRKSSNSLRDSGLETLKESETLSWVGQIVGSRRLLQTRPHSSTVEHNLLRKA